MPRVFLPLLAAVLSVLLVATTGFTERSFIGTFMEERFHGFFFRSYPLLLPAIAYGAVRVLLAVFEAGGRWALRLALAPLGLALLLLGCLYPTFGGIVLRPAFATGGMTFLEGMSATTASMLGAGAAAFVFGLLMGLGAVLARARLASNRGAAGRAVLSFLALWLAAVILLLPQRLGHDLLSGWPQYPLPVEQAPAVAVLVAVAFLPHALLLFWHTQKRG